MLNGKGRDVEEEVTQLESKPEVEWEQQQQEQPESQCPALYLKLQSSVEGIICKGSHVTTEAVTAIAAQARVDCRSWQINLLTRIPT